MKTQGRRHELKRLAVVDQSRPRTITRLTFTAFAALVLALSAGATNAVTRPTQSLARPEKEAPVAATLEYVDAAKLPMARAIIKAFRHTKPSKRRITRHTSAFFPSSYRNVTEILAVIPGKAAFGHGRIVGDYEFGADFRGPIKPENMVVAGVSATPNTNSPGNGYLFTLARTTHDGPTTVMPMHWFMTNGVSRGSKYLHYNYDSCSATGSTGGDSPILTAPILAVAMRQARSVLGQIRHHRRIRWQRDVMRSQEPADAC